MLSYEIDLILGFCLRRYMLEGDSYDVFAFFQSTNRWNRLQDFSRLISFKLKMLNILWVQPLPCEDLLHFFVLCYNKLIIFKFWIIGQENKLLKTSS